MGKKYIMARKEEVIPKLRELKVCMITANNNTIYWLLHTLGFCSLSKTTSNHNEYHSDTEAPANNTEEMKNSRSSSGFFSFWITLLCSFVITSTQSFTLALIMLV